ncbi:MAG TPA: DUF6265 family protein [Ferruginibacter sp.]|nr:DUF6265 family protein [Ferruginibacter sp.]HNF01929.1 DUF6265 family protein [Ferruginibacter sp.]
MKLLTLMVVLLLTGMNPGTTRDERVFKKLFVLEGTWKMTTKRGAVCEEWKKVNEKHLQSRGYFLRGNDTITTERVSLTLNTDGSIYYTSTVEDQNNKQPIAFKLTSAESTRFSFENPAHDFPKRIVYHLLSADSLHAFVDDGTETGKRQNFYYKKQ